MLSDIFHTILTVLGAFITYEVIEVQRKRKIETYWKVEIEYKSDAQQHARKSIDELSQLLLQHDNPVDYYNEEYHNSTSLKNRDLAWIIRTRIRFLHLTGVLLKKRMIDKDLLFSLIGLGFEIDYPVLRIVLDAHRKDHKAPALYNHVEYLWVRYHEWKNNMPIAVA